MATYVVQKVSKPRQIVALKVWHASCVILPIKDVAELIVKPG